MIILPSRYKEIEKPIKGGFGNSVKCKDLHLNRDVIVKQINDSVDIDRLTTEIEALQRSKSKHVVQVYDILYQEDGKPAAIIEEYLPGQDLNNYKADNNDINKYITVLYQLSCGITDIHDCDIVHRDINPNNFKNDAENIIKLFDFGLSKYGILPTSTKFPYGTPGYIAPELFLDPPVIDKPADCYSFGATAFYFVLGWSPKCARSKPVPRQLNPDESIANYIKIEKCIANIIDSCLELDYRKRPLMKNIRDLLKSYLLFGKHKAMIIYEGKTYRLEEINKGVKLTRGTQDSLKITYNGIEFIMSDVHGYISINNIKVSGNTKLEGSCVIVLGSPDLGAYRKFVTFDISYPEVVL